MNPAEELYYLGVKLPDIKLQSLVDNGEITLSKDQRTLTNRPAPSAPPIPPRPPLFFHGACGTEFLPARTYWQVKIRASIKQPVPDGYIMCEVGIASPLALAGAYLVVTPNYSSAATVKMLIYGDKLVASFVVNDSPRYEQWLADFRLGEELEMTVGVFLDASNGRVLIIDVGSCKALYILTWDSTSEFLPVVNCVNAPGRAGREVCMTVESGSSIVLTRKLIDNFIERHSAWRRRSGAR